MIELLTFEERLKKPTEDGLNYESYFVKTITIENGTSLIVTCHDEEGTQESIDRLNALIASGYILEQDDFRFDDIHRLNPTQFRLSGDLREILGEVVRAGCISKALKKEIFRNEKFNQLVPSRKSEGELVELIKTYKPELWEELSSSPEKLQVLVTQLERALTKNSPRGNPSQTTFVK